MDGEKHFWAAGRTIGEVPLDYWHGPGVIVDISDAVSDSSVYTPEMIEDRVDLRDGDILLIRTGYGKYGWNSPDSDEFRYMIKHPGPSPEFSDWCVERSIKWLGIDCVAMEHPMNTIQRVFHPKTFAEANAEAERPVRPGLGRDVPARHATTRTCTSTCSPRASCTPRIWARIWPRPRPVATTSRLHSAGHGAGVLLGTVRRLFPSGGRELTRAGWRSLAARLDSGQSNVPRKLPVRPAQEANAVFENRSARWIGRVVSLAMVFSVLGGHAVLGDPEDEAARTRQDNHIDYVEWESTDLGATKAFYSAVFGWEFTDWGPDYVSFAGGGLDGGFRLVEAVTAGGALVVLYHDDLEAVIARVDEHGGSIVEPIFDFPGGSRFHFADPSGNVLAVWSE